MKKTAITVLLGIFAWGAVSAQTMMDAWTLSEYNYEGTARTIAMGNAFTALGGDLGAVTINPAGNAVARYSQMTITPGINISVNNSIGLPYKDGSANGFNNRYVNRKVEGNLPNIGFAINFDTHRKSGIKNVSVGLVANASNSFLDGAYARGRNPYTSLSGAWAAAAGGLHILDLWSETNEDSAWDSFPWQSVLGAQTLIFEPIRTNDTDSNGDYIVLPDSFVGVSENQRIEGIGADGKPIYATDENGFIIDQQPVDQTYARKLSGTKYDYVINLSANISDMVFIGANLGMTSVLYKSDEVISESTDESEVFQSGFKSLRYSNHLRTSGTGIYGKFGVIVTPVAGLRLGAAIQTPTYTALKDYYYMSAITHFTDSRNDKDVSSPHAEYEYSLTSPFRFNVGAAYTFGRFGLVSVDYEMCDYSGMKFADAYDIESSDFIDTNNEIKEFMGKSHILRAGIEVKPVSSFAIRAGYGFKTSPEMYYNEHDIKQYVKNLSQNFSFGLGYSSDGSFFADIAAMGRMTKEYLRPYTYSLEDDFSPTIETRRTLWNVALTLGWRF